MLERDSRGVTNFLSERVPEWCILLTATIQAQDNTFCDRRDTVQRHADYQRAIRFWAGERFAPRLVLVENSGADLSALQSIFVVAGWKQSNFELLSYTEPPFPRELGKSYGELRILQFAFEHSRIVRDARYILKGTGRYIPTNFFRVWPRIMSAAEIFAMANSNGDNQSDSRFFAGSKAFFRNYLFATLDQINDGSGYHMEHALYDAMARASFDGHRVLPLPGGGFLVDGVQGSRNAAFQYPYHKRIAYRLIARVRNGLPFNWRVQARRTIL